MAADLYGDEVAPDKASASAPETEETQETEDTGKKTALIDSSICPGMEPGEDMVVRIEKVLDGEYLVSYAPEPGKEEGEEEGEDYSMPGPKPGSMGAMME